MFNSFRNNDISSICEFYLLKGGNISIMTITLVTIRKRIILLCSNI